MHDVTISRVDLVELYGLMAIVIPFLPGPCDILLDLIAYASSQDINDSETRIEPVYHRCRIEEVCVSGASQQP